MENFEKFIENKLDETLEKSNGIALSLLIVSDKLKEIGLYDDKEKESIENIRAKSMGVYSFCQHLCKEINKFKKEKEGNKNE